MTLDQIATIVGTNVAAISIIIVYHMFALQTWTERSESLLEQAIHLSLTTMPDDLQRETLRQRASHHHARFPWGQVIILGMCVGAMAGLGAVAARNTVNVCLGLLLCAPLAILIAVYLASTLNVFRNGNRAFLATVDYLGDAPEA